jgi:hypothetical protein
MVGTYGRSPMSSMSGNASRVPARDQKLDSERLATTHTSGGAAEVRSMSIRLRARTLLANAAVQSTVLSEQDDIVLTELLLPRDHRKRQEQLFLQGSDDAEGEAQSSEQAEGGTDEE